MDWTMIGSLAQVIQVIVVAISLRYIYLQIKQQTKLAKVANAQALIELVSPQALQVIQDRQLAEFVVNGAEKYGQMEEVDQYRYRQLVSWRLNCWENIFFQYNNELIDEAIYSTWQSAYERWAKKHLDSWWDELKGNYHPEFRSYVETIINKGSENSEKIPPAAQSA